MKVFRLTFALVFMLFLLAVSCAPTPPVEPVGTTDYWPPSACRNCHYGIYSQYEQSMHSKSFKNPVFRAQYFKDLLPRLETEPELLEEAESCTACHAPVAYAKLKRHLTPDDPLVPPMAEVACDFCHSIEGYEGDKAGNGNYIADSMVGRKLGPFRTATRWHHVYSEFQTKSEFCGICHNDHNHNGLEIKSTYTEWKNSLFAKKGIQCQDCHMNVLGSLTRGRPIFAEGMAAEMTMGRAPYRRRLYTHKFPGAHSNTQIGGSMTLTVETEQFKASPGDEIKVHVYVDNSKSGHKMPTGSADLRLLWLEVRAYTGDRIIPVAVSSGTEGQDAYDVTGASEFDRQALGDAVPKDDRIYRAVFVDKSGKQTLSSYDATEIVFDNRLNAGEIRKENYSFKIPADAENAVWLVATLNYMPYPSYFAKIMGLPEPAVVEVALGKASINLK